MIIRIILVRIITILSSDGSDGLGRRRDTSTVMTGGINMRGTMRDQKVVMHIMPIRYDTPLLTMPPRPHLAPYLKCRIAASQALTEGRKLEQLLCHRLWPTELPHFATSQSNLSNKLIVCLRLPENHVLVDALYRKAYYLSLLNPNLIIPGHGRFAHWLPSV